MASFNLGRIKGEKGDKGDTGAKGDRGEKGEKGDTGSNGLDGRTPVFTVGETVTISPDEEAHVELNSDDTENPVLSFYIPRGHNGRDAMGDMLAAVYDTEGKGEDFYKYADSLFENALKKEDTTVGRLTVGEADGKNAVVRNISMRSTLPESAVEGDICIITEDENTKRLGDCEVGDTMLIEEHGESVPYTIIAKDYHGENNITLIRKKIPSLGVKFNYQGNQIYSISNLDMVLSAFTNRFSGEVRKNLICTQLNVNDSRFCFALSKDELEGIDYLKEPSNRVTGDSLEQYFTRTVTGERAYFVTAAGALALTYQSDYKLYRPTIVLPSSLAVENTVSKDSPAVKMPDTKKGVYTFFGGEWKECASL